MNWYYFSLGMMAMTILNLTAKGQWGLVAIGLLLVLAVQAIQDIK